MGQIVLRNGLSKGPPPLGSDTCGLDSLLFSKEKRGASQQKGGFLESDQGSLIGSHLASLLEGDLAGQCST